MQQTLITLDDWLRWLESAHPVDIDLGLERVAEVARRMGLLTTPLAGHVITVAGTNGKGSTVAMLESLALAHGLTTATYTSPHLLRYNERLRLSGENASDAALIEGFEAVETARCADATRQRDEISLTYFEAGTLGALHVIHQRQPELAILEVGLGGRLDAVNIIDPDVAVVTTIAQDHASFLGDDLEVIGWEKAGIMRAGHPAVLGSSALPASVSATARQLDAPLHTLGQTFSHQNCSLKARPGDVDSRQGWRWSGLDARGRGCHLEDLPDPGLPLDNAATALQALSLAQVALDVASCRQALAQVSLPGRMQWCGQWCLDVGHNPHAASYLAGRLATYLTEQPAEQSSKGRVFGLLGMLGDKDAEGVIDALAPVIDAWLPVSLSGPRARQADELAELLGARGQRVLHRAASPLAGAYWLAACLAPEDRVLVCGSFFTVAEILGAWEAGDLGTKDDSPCEVAT